MFYDRSHMVACAMVLTTMLGLVTHAHAQGLARLSLTPQAALLDNGASLLRSGFDAPIRLPANGSTPSLALGFTIPNDYASNTALRLIILWESPATQCDFVLRSGSLFRARAGQPRDFGDASAGLRPVNASTPFSLPFTGTIMMAAPNTAHRTARVRFNITSTPGEFPAFRSGDAVNFGIFRDDSALFSDTCSGDLGIAGISIVYRKRP